MLSASISFSRTSLRHTPSSLSLPATRCVSPAKGRKRVAAWAPALKQASRRCGSLVLSLLTISIRASNRRQLRTLHIPRQFLLTRTHYLILTNTLLSEFVWCSA